MGELEKCRVVLDREAISDSAEYTFESICLIIDEIFEEQRLKKESELTWYDTGSEDNSPRIGKALFILANEEWFASCVKSCYWIHSIQDTEQFPSIPESGGDSPADHAGAHVEAYSSPEKGSFNWWLMVWACLRQPGETKTSDLIRLFNLRIRLHREDKSKTIEMEGSDLYIKQYHDKSMSIYRR